MFIQYKILIIKQTFGELIMRLWYHQQLLSVMVTKMEQFVVQVKYRNMRELLNDDEIMNFALMSNKKVIELIDDREK